ARLSSGAAGQTRRHATDPAAPHVHEGGGDGGRHSGGGGSRLAELTLPAGSYLIEAKVVLVSGAAETTMSCFLGPAPTGKPELDVAEASAGSRERNTLSLIGVQTLGNTATVELLCSRPKGTGKFDQAHMVAIKTAAIHGTLPVD